MAIILVRRQMNLGKSWMMKSLLMSTATQVMAQLTVLLLVHKPIILILMPIPIMVMQVGAITQTMSL